MKADTPRPPEPPAAPPPVPADAAKRLVLHFDPTGWVGPALVVALLGSISAVCAATGDVVPAIGTRVGAVIALGVLLARIVAAMDRRPQLIIDVRGIQGRQFRYGFIPWEDINSVRLRQTDGRDYITFTVSYLEKYLDRLPTHRRISVWLWSFMGVEEIHISATGLQVNTEDIWNHVVNVIQPASLGHTDDADTAQDADPPAILGDGRGDR